MKRVLSHITPEFLLTPEHTARTVPQQAANQRYCSNFAVGLDLNMLTNWSLGTYVCLNSALQHDSELKHNRIRAVATFLFKLRRFAHAASNSLGTFTKITRFDLRFGSTGSSRNTSRHTRFDQRLYIDGRLDTRFDILRPVPGNCR